MARRDFKIELLAPAKDKTCAFAAINCGADAIYIGANDFGARKNACNSLSDLQEIIDYAHKFRVKVFVTVNTVLFDNELENAKNLIQKLYEMQTDAIIVQDMGLCEMNLAPILLHASTQCHNSTLEKVQFLEACGFQRAILARELSIKEIKNIAKNTNIELETFIQGALCVSYSGQCYMSYAIGGRSANRGECAQPCRKKYSIQDSNGKFLAQNQHLLCLKDFNASDYLEDLIDAGVSSFKIEGRLKDENYIKNTVSFYRKELDKIIAKKGLQRASYGICETDFAPYLNKTFNRGFCQYFLNGRDKKITSFKTPKNLGEFIGTVKQVKKDCFSLNGELLNRNDGIAFFVDNELCGTKIEKVQNGWYYPNSMKNLEVGTKIFRNVDFEFLKALEKTSPKRKIPVNIELSITKEKFSAEISDEEKNTCSLKIENNFEPSQNEQKAKENLLKQFSKLGDTEFVLNNIKLTAENMPFIKINEINDLRRKIVNDFIKIREKNYTIKKQQPIKPTKYFQNEADYKLNVTNELAKQFYEKCGVNVLEYGLEHPSQANYSNKEVMTTKHCLRYSLGFCAKTGKKVNEPLCLIDETGKKYKLEFDCKNCQMKVIY